MDCGYSPLNDDNIPPESPAGPLWKPDLYKLQQEAPKPRAVKCPFFIFDCPPQYGPEFHGRMSHVQAADLLKTDGDYLVRMSISDGSFTLSLRFRGKIKHFRLYYNELSEQHYVCDNGKRYSHMSELVADGLITLHIEAEAGPYIQLMCDVVKYEKSPAYLTLTRFRKRARPLKEETILYDKNHNFKVRTFKGLNWCEFCTNFLWGFTAQGVRCEDCGVSVHVKCSEKMPPDCCPELKHIRSVFGVDLTTLVRVHKTTRPFVVDICVQEIEARGLCVEGLYRVSGFADEMDSLRMAFEKDGDKADISAAAYENINVIAGVLKQYFRHLPIPLITYDVQPSLLKAQHHPLLKEKIKHTKEALSQLPPAHYNTLSYLMTHLHRVHEHRNTNKMSAFNLSTVFAPTLMPPLPAELSGAIPDMSGEINALSLLILHHKAIFQPPYSS